MSHFLGLLLPSQVEYQGHDDFDMHAGILVEDAKHAYEHSTANGAVGVTPPTVLKDEATGTEQTVSEILAYGDCVLRFVSGTYQVSARCAWPSCKSRQTMALQSCALAVCAGPVLGWLHCCGQPARLVRAAAAGPRRRQRAQPAGDGGLHQQGHRLPPVCRIHRRGDCLQPRHSLLDSSFCLSLEM